MHTYDIRLTRRPAVPKHKSSLDWSKAALIISSLVASWAVTLLLAWAAWQVGKWIAQQP